MNIRLFIFLLCISISSFSCSSRKLNDKTKLEEMSWLLGKWQVQNKNALQFEVWEKANDTLYQGFSYLVFDSDTVILEYVDLQLDNKELYYIPLVVGQNDDTPVAFKLIEQKGKKFTFENKKHNFPQRIVYNNYHKDSTYAYIEGVNSGKNVKKDFFMWRE